MWTIRRTRKKDKRQDGCFKTLLLLYIEEQEIGVIMFWSQPVGGNGASLLSATPIFFIIGERKKSGRGNGRLHYLTANSTIWDSAYIIPLQYIFGHKMDDSHTHKIQSYSNSETPTKEKTTSVSFFSLSFVFCLLVFRFLSFLSQRDERERESSMVREQQQQQVHRHSLLLSCCSCSLLLLSSSLLEFFKRE